MLNRRLKMTSIAHYSENTASMDSTIMHRHRHDVTSMLNIAPLGLIALVVRCCAALTHLTSNGIRNECCNIFKLSPRS
jgi:hypothetical protein